jgi:hypothetical protein
VLLTTGIFTLFPPARAADETGVFLNQSGRISYGKELHSRLRPTGDNSGESTPPNLRGDCYVESVSGCVTFSFGEGSTPKTIRFYDPTFGLKKHLDFQQIINLTLSPTGQYAAFFDGEALTTIDLTTGENWRYPAATIFDLDDLGRPFFYDYETHCVRYRDMTFPIDTTPLSLHFLADTPIIFTASELYLLRSGQLKSIFASAGRFFDVRMLGGRLYFVERSGQGRLRHYKLYELETEFEIELLEERTCTKPGETLDTHERIRAPLYYNETSFASVVKNSYAQLQEWSSLYLHPGVDFFADPFENVYSVQDGVVEAILTTGDERYWRIAIGNLGEVEEGYLYAHLNQDSFSFGVGDSVTAGDVIGTIFPAWGFEPHCHFARIAPSAHIWNGDWWTVDNPLVDVTNMTDSISPVIEYALGSERFAFRTREGVYLDPLNLSGEIKIIAKCVDYAVSTAFESRINVWDLQFRLFAPENPFVPVYEQYSFVQDMPLDTYFSNEYETLVLETMYSRDQTCFSTNNSTTKDFYYILTNSDGDSAITAADSLEIFDTRNFYNGPYLLEVIVHDCAGNSTSGSMAIFIDNDFPPYRQMDGLPEGGTLILEKNHPDPFNPTTTITYLLPAAGRVTLDIFDLQGRKVKTLVEGWQAAGRHEVTFSGLNLPSGMYPYRLVAGNRTLTEKMLLIK